MNNNIFGTLPDRNIMICYGDEDYPYTPAPEIDETVVLTEGAG